MDSLLWHDVIGKSVGGGMIRINACSVREFVHFSTCVMEYARKHGWLDGEYRAKRNQVVYPITKVYRSHVGKKRVSQPVPSPH
jgi:hypothetical protein